MVNVLGVSATRAGVSIIPLSLGVMIGSFLAGQMVFRFGHYRRFMLAGGVVFLVGAILLSTMGVSTRYWTVTLYMVICGVGIGPTMPLFPLAIQNSVSFQKIGQATSASQFFRQIGGTVGTAVMGTVLATTLAAAFAHVPGGAGFAAATAHGGVEPALVKVAFATAITRIYTYLIFILLPGIIATLFVPELPLRRSHGDAPAGEPGQV